MNLLTRFLKFNAIFYEDADKKYAIIPIKKDLKWA